MQNYTNKRVIIPKFGDIGADKYFSPRFITIQKGEVIEWINFDTNPHVLVFSIVKPISNISIPSLGPINPDDLKEMSFNYDVRRIDYNCKFHPFEKGSIIVLPNRDLNNTEYLRFLQDVFDIPTPDILNHLRFNNIANVN